MLGQDMSYLIKVAMVPGFHLFPFRTEKLSPTAPMVLPYRWESRSSPNTIALQDSEGLFCFKSRTDAWRSGIPTPPVYALPAMYGGIPILPE